MAHGFQTTMCPLLTESKKEDDGEGDEEKNCHPGNVFHFEKFFNFFL